MNKFVLIGKNINYSLSPYIYQYLANYYHINDFKYEIINLESFHKDILKQYKGYNITTPYKEEVVKYLNNYNEITMANCVYQNKGYNFDLDAFIYSYKRLIKNKNIKKVVILGNGSISKMLQNYFKMNNITVYVYYYKDPLIPSLLQGDLLINTTPCGQGLLEDQLPIYEEYITNFKYVFDLNYNPDINPLLILCKKHQIIHQNGLIMLIHQAISAFSLWFNISPNYNLIYKIKSYLDTIRFKNICLIGMPFSGKSLLAKQYLHYLDLDNYMESCYGKDYIKTLLSNNQEAKFRQIETQSLKAVVNNKNYDIISLGGGIIKDYYNLYLLRHSKIIYLPRSINYLLTQCDYQSRPLVKNKNDLIQLYNQRKPIYLQWETK